MRHEADFDCGVPQFAPLRGYEFHVLEFGVKAKDHKTKEKQHLSTCKKEARIKTLVLCTQANKPSDNDRPSYH